VNNSIDLPLGSTAIPSFTRPSALAILVGALLLAGCRRAEAQPPPLVVNECASGSGGWIEVFNRGTTARELARDPARCWLVDDIEGGGAPKVITDLVVNHPAGSTTCSALGRPATCGVVGPGERVWVKYAYFNAASADTCRLASAPRTGTTCGTALTDQMVGSAISSTAAGQCFGRQPDGEGWAAGPLPCTQGLSNGGCNSGVACDDGNPCTTGETFSSACACTGGAPRSGSTCGPNKSCQAGVCTASPSGSAPGIVRQGTGGLLLMGTLVTPDEVLEGELLIVGDEIRCVGPSCQSDPAAATVSIVQTNGIIFPGLIDTHNHIQFDIFDESDWAPTAADNFTNHDQWPARARYKALVDTKQHLTGEEGSPVKIGCELVKYGELKGLIAGTTSIVGAAIAANRKCYGTVARTIDQSPNGLATDTVQVATLFPRDATEADRVCKNLTDAAGTTESYLIHIGEGVDLKSRNEFGKLIDVTTVDGCLLGPKTTIVHGTALEEPELDQMRSHDMSLVWSPRSNIFLYGHGTDLSKTSNIPAAIEKGINIALAPDWSIGGSQNLLDELRFADQVDNAQWGDAITPKKLVQMVTKNSARALGLAQVLGELAPGRKADITVIGGDRTRPYEALLGATPKSVRLVLVGGAALYGDPALRPLGQSTPACDTLDICGAAKFACIAQSGGAASDKLGQSYPQIKSAIESALTAYDAAHPAQPPFSPIAPLYKCP
jgi:5-methylthioadenosine/S-adenosylhomocysteine deaminase